MRVFFALWPEAIQRNSLAAWQAPLLEQCGGRAMRAETLHSTLVFLGEVESGKLEALRLAAQEVSVKSFNVEFDVARYWGHNHIVYAAPQYIPDAMRVLANELQHRLQKHHFRFAAQDYKPHITLLRKAIWRDVPLPVMQKVIWSVRDFVLVESLSDEQGANYLILERFPLMQDDVKN
ncbi:MAG: RNA 2',3'-cyclic phosphodiesterase [Gallionellaceae bacterium]|jgi:2'-5' RNA ligase